MDQSAVDSPVTLVIKAPNQKYDDQTIKCFLNWTVKKLKAHLSDVYPSKPTSKDQRLVYSGRLLLDHLQLRDVFRKHDEYHMVHLVCASRTPPGSPEHSGSNMKTTAPASLGPTNLESEASTPASSRSQETLPVSTSTEGLRHRNSQQQQTSPELSYASPDFMQGHLGNPGPMQHGIPAGLPMYPLYSPIQMLWWQQMYARHYYMQFRAAAASSQGSDSVLPSIPTSSQSTDPPPQNEPPVVPNAAVPENRPVNQNIQMNAQGGPVINDDGVNQDWLDWMYTFSRAAILLSILYFYSSFSRFVMVMGAMLLVYLHQAGWFPFRPDVQNQPGEVNQEEQEADFNQDMQDMQEMERLMDDGLDEDSGDDTVEGPDMTPHPGCLASAWSFITTFFTSLIPEGPPHPAN